MDKPKFSTYPDDYEDKPIDDEDNPEWTEDDFANAKPFKEALPELYAAWVANGRKFNVKRRGRPPQAEQTKVHIGFRLSQDVVDGIRASGPGYNARVDEVLRAALAEGRL